MIYLQLIDSGSTQVVALPITRADAKTHLRITHTSHDDLIDDLIYAAAKEFENYTNLCLTAQSWYLVLNQAEVNERIEFFKYPVSSVTSVSYYDADNTLTTLSSTDYTLFKGRPSSIIFDDVPSTYDRDDSMTIRFVGGYAVLPFDIKQALLARIYRIYENPNDPVSERQTYFDNIARSYRSYDL